MRELDDAVGATADQPFIECRMARRPDHDEIGAELAGEADNRAPDARLTHGLGA